MSNEDLYDVALAAVMELFGDTSVSRGDCRRNLNALQGEISNLLDALDVDDANDESASNEAG